MVTKNKKITVTLRGAGLVSSVRKHLRIPVGQGSEDVRELGAGWWQQEPCNKCAETVVPSASTLQTVKVASLVMRLIEHPKTRTALSARRRGQGATMGCPSRHTRAKRKKAIPDWVLAQSEMYESSLTRATQHMLSFHTLFPQMGISLRLPTRSACQMVKQYKTL